VWVPLLYLGILGAVKLCLGRRFVVTPCTPSIYISGNGVLLAIGILLLAYAVPPGRSLSFVHPEVLTVVLPVSCIASMLQTKKCESSDDTDDN
jgi:hypothetical protein